MDEFARGQSSELGQPRRAPFHRHDRHAIASPPCSPADRACMRWRPAKSAISSGKDIVHLQCHIGLDTISLKHLGASSVTGLDFSPKAIAAARDFAAKSGHRSALRRGLRLRRGRGARPRPTTWPSSPGARSTGSTTSTAGRAPWPSVLRPGGTLYLLEGHPTMNQMYPDRSPLTVELDWRTPPRRPHRLGRPADLHRRRKAADAGAPLRVDPPAVGRRQRADRGRPVDRLPERARHRRLEGLLLSGRNRRGPVLAARRSAEDSAVVLDRRDETRSDSVGCLQAALRRLQFRRQAARTDA